MANVLVIGEKPSQVKTMAETLLGSHRVEQVAKQIYLRKGSWNGHEITFLPLIGHITNIDTPEEFGWNKVEPLEIVTNPNALVVKENPIFQKIITQLARQADEIWLATDPDSEGDNIAYEAYNIATRAKHGLKVLRVWNSSLTKREIIRAFNDLRQWEPHLALAVQGRRIIDAWVGFAGTREVTHAARKVLNLGKKVLSVGRVQLPTLKLIVDRDRERERFETKSKYNIMADLLDDSRQSIIISVKHDKSPFDDEKDVSSVLSKIKDATTGIIDDFIRRTTRTPSPQPLNTTDALSLLSQQLKIKADTAMEILATLYEEGYISYPRTDNRRFKDQFPHGQILNDLAKHSPFIPFLKRITDSRQVRNNGKKQGPEDHDPIHPTGNIPKAHGRIKQQHVKAWEIISRYYIGLFMPDLVMERGSVKVMIKDEMFSQDYQLTLDFGWTEAIEWKKPRDTTKFSFNKGQVINVGNIRSEEFKTKPPPPWSDSTLIRMLERLQIGTKSSRPEVINKLIERNYIIRKRRFYHSTPTGRSIIELFESIWPDLVTPAFTRMVEQKMDEVATKKAPFETMLEEMRTHYINLHKKLIAQLDRLQDLLTKTTSNSSLPVIKEKKGEDKKAATSNTITCPSCRAGILVERINSKTKEKFFGCSRYPTCTWTSPRKKVGDTFVPEKLTREIIGLCPQCAGSLTYKKVKKYRLIGCTNYPTCQQAYFLPEKGRITILKKKCNECQRRMISHVAPTGEKRTFCVTCNTKNNK